MDLDRPNERNPSRSAVAIYQDKRQESVDSNPATRGRVRDCGGRAPSPYAGMTLGSERHSPPGRLAERTPIPGATVLVTVPRAAACRIAVTAGDRERPRQRRPAGA
jgi:hypothetical protein